jgi:hypothetical protein
MSKSNKYQDKSDVELAADARMVVQELSDFMAEFKRRGIEMDISTYSSGRAEVEIYRDKREVL